MPGTLQELRVRAYLDLLQERDSRGQPAPATAGEASGEAGETGEPDSPGGPGGNGGPGPAPRPGPAAGPSLAALVTLTSPWATLPGRSETPGEADGFGPLDGDDARDLAAAAARHPATRWCLTALNPDGTAAAHGCLPGRHPPPGTGPPGTGPPGSLNLTMIPVTRGPCDHAHAEIGYHPSRALQHLIRARSATCTAPGCRPRPPAATWTTPSPGTRAGSAGSQLDARGRAEY